MKTTIIKEVEINEYHTISLVECYKIDCTYITYEIRESINESSTFTSIIFKRASEKFDELVATAKDNQEWNGKLQKLHMLMKSNGGERYTSKVHLSSLCMLLVNANYNEIILDKDLLLDIQEEWRKNGV